ncbi:pentapeptide repeat-containing protein [Georgenia sp. TF02-10]|uniref:pentapeptide repeat-containing protein n=1 Tax=Georgenia sp. TF02-10 TaxID=2917725 RepID=UPI001FA70A1C|nr:pentapeptide repeat-containing protein [Georgenia sp. TF02-10]UNX56067.1 pentapeptide repeat-containing protein [Georgenia sp. TF02-10]
MVDQPAAPVASREALRADCGSCFALCCVALSFARSADFAITKPAGDPCPNLAADDSCTIHARLRPSGFKGCTVFDCFGAGQKVSRQTFDGVSWRADPETRAQMFAVFPVVRQLHEVLWFLNEARIATGEADPLVIELAAATTRVEALTLAPAAEILDIDVDAVRGDVRPLLLAASERVRSRYARQRGTRGAGQDTAGPARPGRKGQPRTADAGSVPRVGPGADLIGARLRRLDLRGADLRGAYLIGADLSGSDLRGADVLGADLRDAEVTGADLSEALYLTQTQVNAVRGNAATRLPPGLDRPTHWS